MTAVGYMCNEKAGNGVACYAQNDIQQHHYPRPMCLGCNRGRGVRIPGEDIDDASRVVSQAAHTCLTLHVSHIYPMVSATWCQTNW